MTIRNFRGFRDEQVIAIDASAVVIGGPNGLGKTSFFDAVQWLLIGRLPRLAALASRRSGDYVVNSFSGGEPASVAVELVLSGRPVEAIRRGTVKTSTLEWRDADGVVTGGEAERKLALALLAGGTATLEDTLLTSALLQQDVVRLVLADEPKNRYRHLAGLLGLHDLGAFEDYVRLRAESTDKTAKEARLVIASADQQVEGARAEYRRLEVQLASVVELSSLRAGLERRLEADAPVLREWRLPLDLSEVTALSYRVRQVRGACERLASQEARLREEELAVLPVTEDEVHLVEAEERELAQKVEAARAAVQEVKARREHAEKLAGDLATLAANALPLLSATCPVCGQAIDAEHVRGDLERLVATRGEGLTDLRAAAQTASDAAASTDRELANAQTRKAEMERRQKASHSVRAARTEWLRLCDELAASVYPAADDEVDRLRKGDPEAISRLRQSADIVTGLVDELATALGASTLVGQAERQRGVLQELETRTKALRESAAAASRRADEARALRDASTRAIAEVTRQRFHQLQPLINDIFGRLDPNPIFTRLRFDLGVSYRSGVADPVVFDLETGASGDPLLVLSSAQANVAALTYFLASSWAAEGQGLPFLLLDDPLQSMDDVNALGFADLCRHLRDRRQLIISTHEPRLERLLARKLAPRRTGDRTIVLHFVGWDRSGPRVEQEEAELVEAPYLLTGTES